MLVAGLTLACPALGVAQSGFVTEAGEYAPAGSLVGDQVYAHASIKPGGGFIVWQDNNTDGEGLGVSAQRLDSSLSGTLSSFRVNGLGANDQERPQVTMLNGGGAAFVWQGGKLGFQRIYARFLSASNTWVAGDMLVNTFTNSQKDAAVATLTSGSVVVAWANTTNNLRDVYFQRLSPTGQRLGGEVLANQFTAYNQRDPAVAALSDGRFVVVWISEQQRSAFSSGGDNIGGVLPAATGAASADVYARIFTAAGVPAGSEFLVSSAGVNPCANPSVAAAADGGFTVAWMQKDLAVADNSWDVFARPVSGGAVGGTIRRVNTVTHGDQLAPKISALGTDYLVVWTSMGQDGSQEGVYGQFLLGDGAFNGGEFRVNTTTPAFQKFPAVASDGVARFLTVWSSFVGGAASVDINAQRFASTSQPLTAPDAPFVTVLSSNALSVTWPVLQGYSVAGYQVFADGAGSPTATVTNNWWTLTGLAAGSTHYFQLKYVLTDGRQSPLSAATTNTTYGALTYGGIPYEWMLANFGFDLFSWPSPFADTDGDGVSNLNEWLAGTNPTNAASVLRVRLRSTAQGLFLDWNTEAGLLYQVQAAPRIGQWTNVGGARFAAGATDSMPVGGGSAGFYRILRIR